MHPNGKGVVRLFDKNATFVEVFLWVHVEESWMDQLPLLAQRETIKLVAGFPRREFVRFLPLSNNPNTMIITTGHEDITNTPLEHILPNGESLRLHFD